MPPDIPYFDAGQLVAEVFAAAFLPPTPVNAAEWATRHRWLTNDGGGYVGRWRHDIAPYLREPMEVVSDNAFLTGVVVGPGQCGKTEIGLNWLGASIDGNPGDLLWYMQTDSAVQAFVKSRINPMIDEHEVLRSKRGLRATDDSLSYKQFTGMAVEFLAATRSAMINKRAPRILADEWDAYDPSIGDPKILLDIRRQTFGRESMLLALSHPDRAGGLDPRHWNAGIMALYAQSDRRIWYWQCPECGAWSSPNPTAERVMVLDYPDADGVPLDEIADATRLLCPVNGCVLEDAARKQMNLTGRWIGAGQTIDQDGTVTGALAPSDAAGFWIVGLMSPFLLQGMGGLARDRVKATREREATGSDTTLKEVIVKGWGLPYERPRAVGSIDANVLADRADASLPLGIVPEGVRFLTGFADVQANRFETLIRGWGPRGESWIIDHRMHRADTATSPEAWDALFVWLLDTPWPLAGNPGRFMRLRAAGFDSAGAPGVTQQAYDAWRRALAARKTRMLGRFDGREAWNLIGTKGAASLGAAPLQVTRPDSARNDRRARSGGAVPIALFGANGFKDNLAGQLGRGEPGPWYVHFPAGLRSEAPPHLWFEQLVAETRKKNGAWEQTAARNEALDLMVGCHVVAHLHGLARINWDRPPAWAAAWDTNISIGATTAGPVAGMAPTAPAAAPPSAAAGATALPGPRSLGAMLP
jgi:phage terminase large subunit GpA-like protein